MKIKAVQLYGIPSDFDQIKQILNESSISQIEGNLISHNEISSFKNWGVSFSGGHCNLKLLSELNEEMKKDLMELYSRELIIPTFVEENSMCWPFSFFRRFPGFYKKLRDLADLIKFKSMRRVVLPSHVKKISYFKKKFWEDSAKLVNSLVRDWEHVGYHNHGLEFQSIDGGVTPIQVLDERLDEKVSFQFDITNSLMAEYFSVDLIRKYLHRIKSFHVRIEGVGSELFYEKLVKDAPDIFQGKEIVIELKENTQKEMINRIKWWSKQFELVS